MYIPFDLVVKGGKRMTTTMTVDYLYSTKYSRTTTWNVARTKGVVSEQ